MELLLIFIILGIGLAIFLFLIVMLVLRSMHDYNVPLQSKEKLFGTYANQKDSFEESEKKIKVLFIFPHPDDEVMMAGGLICQLAKDSRYFVEVISVTAGQHGTELLQLSPEKLGNLRKQEFANAMSKLCVKNSAVWNFTDGKVQEQLLQLKEKLASYFYTMRPDFVVTYERWGIYGHPDHIALSKLVADLTTQQRFKRITPLYSTLPNKILTRLKLPLHMARNPRRIDQANPEIRINNFVFAWKKAHAASFFKSQKLPKFMKNFVGNAYEYYTFKY